MKDMGGLMEGFINKMAERAGFEPAVRALNPYTRLAGGRLQPLGHLSVKEKW